MATSIRRRIIGDQREYNVALRNYRSISHCTFNYHEFDYTLLRGGRTIEKSRYISVRLQAHSFTGLFPDEPLSNVIVIGDNAYCYNGLFWSFDLLMYTWEVMHLRSTIDVANAIEIRGVLLEVVDEDEGIFRLTQIRSNNLLVITDYRLDNAPSTVSSTIPSLTVSYRPSSRQLSERTNQRTQAEKEIEEKKERIRKLREDDCKNDSLSANNYSRRCGICFIDNPSRRAVFTSCGHCSCFACAVELSNADGRLDCPFCRKKTGFIKLFEDKN